MIRHPTGNGYQLRRSVNITLTRCRVKLWIISQDENRNYDTYDSAVVAAETEAEARVTMPSEGETFGKRYGAWCSSPKAVKVELIGTAVAGTKAGVILASFNAG